MEKIEFTPQEILNSYKTLQQIALTNTLDGIIDAAREFNFPEKRRDGAMNRTLHGTEFLFGLFKKGIITHDLYEQLKRVAEDPTLEYEIKII